MKRALESASPRSKQSRRNKDLARQPRQIESPYLTSAEAVEYLLLPSLSALYSHVRENRLPVAGRVGSELRFDKRELDAWVRTNPALALVRERA